MVELKLEKVSSSQSDNLLITIYLIKKSTYEDMCFFILPS